VSANVSGLSCYRECAARIESEWPSFSRRRTQWMAQHHRGGPAAEKVAENVLQDLFTSVLDWSIADLNNQLGRADIVLAHLGMRWLIVEVKRPGTLSWGHRGLAAALEQARGYAEKQRVRQVAVSDGTLLYAAELISGGVRDRLLVRLDRKEPPIDLWWISANGIYRPRPAHELAMVADQLETVARSEENDPLISSGGQLLHPRYGLPATCFAYVGDPSWPTTWRLPYLLADGSIDTRRLPKAIQSVLSNYRGTRTTTVPEAAVPEVMVRLARAAARAGRLPEPGAAVRDVYGLLADYLDQNELRPRVDPA